MIRYFIQSKEQGKQIIMFLLIIVLSSAYNDLISQNVGPKPSRQSSFEAFSKGNYEQAYKEFSELLQIYTKDPLYKYYSGVCLVNLKRDPVKAELLLKQALQGAAVVKTLPSDALFYLGRAQQMSGKFTEALFTYNQFTKQVGKKAAREENVDEFIKESKENRGEIAASEIRQPEIAAKSKAEVSQVENKSVTKEAIQKPVEKEAATELNVPASFDEILKKAVEYQFKADSLNTLVVRQKKDLETLPDKEKPSARMKINENETLASSFQKSADQKYNEARAAMAQQQDTSRQIVAFQQPESKVAKDSVQKTENVVIKEPEIKIDTIKKVVPAAIKTIDVFSYFEVLTTAESIKENKITVNGEVPDGLIYRIQIGVFSKPVMPSFFKGISPIYGFKIPGTENTSYFAGMFRRVTDAGKAVTTVRSTGFKDAFVVSFSGKVRISADRATIMEKEWGNKPFATIAQASPDTIPPTLLFRVEVVRSPKPLKEDVVEGIKKMAGNRGLDIQSPDKANTVYLIGKFITFESAAEYADLLIRNGYRESKVVAFMGKKEIPVETAKQLVEDRK